jgi:hypothetical protein
MIFQGCSHVGCRVRRSTNSIVIVGGCVYRSGIRLAQFAGEFIHYCHGKSSLDLTCLISPEPTLLSVQIGVHLPHLRLQSQGGRGEETHTSISDTSTGRSELHREVA